MLILQNSTPSFIFPSCNLITSPPLLTWFTSSLVPDRLHQGQVTRAQEAEENYLVKRELATVKQQNEEASAQLEQAQNTIRQLQHLQHQTAVRTVHRQPPPLLLDGRTASENAAQRKTGYSMRKAFRAHFKHAVACCTGGL